MGGLARTARCRNTKQQNLATSRRALLICSSARTANSNKNFHVAGMGFGRLLGIGWGSVHRYCGRRYGAWRQCNGILVWKSTLDEVYQNPDIDIRTSGWPNESGG